MLQEGYMGKLREWSIEWWVFHVMFDYVNLLEGSGGEWEDLGIRLLCWIDSI